MPEQPVTSPRNHWSLSEILTYQRLLRRQGPDPGVGKNLPERVGEVKKTVDAAREKDCRN